MKRSLIVSLMVVFVFVTRISLAQVSLVPANHEVYNWLHKQRIMGNVGQYSFETLPLSRETISELLNSIGDEHLNKVDQSHLKTYLYEFSRDSLILASQNTLTQGKRAGFRETAKMKWNLLKSNIEPHLYVHYDSTALLNVDYYYGTGLVNPKVEGQTDWTRYRFNAMRIYGTFRKSLGLYLELVHLKTNEDGGALSQVDFWGATNGALDQKRTSFYLETMVSARYKKLSLHIGNGNIKYGVGNDESMIFRLKAPNFNWVRLNYDSKFFNYTFLHGRLNDNVVLVEDPLNAGIFDLNRIQRWVTIRRLQIKPFKWARLAFTEVLSYSNRGIQLSYINPIYPLRIAEFNLGDLDNPVWYLEGTLSPFKGIEAYGTLGIDDLNSVTDIFKPTGSRSNETAVLLYQAGIHIVPKGLFQLNLEYLRIDPFFYSHKFNNNAFVSSVQHGTHLGHSIGPNADQVHFSLKKWLPKRGWIRGYVSFVRKGLNPLDDQGAVELNTGGDIGLGRFDGTTIVRFLSGDQHKYNHVGIEGYFEPWRGVGLNLNYQRRTVTQGTRISNLSQYGFKVSVNFYPISRLINAAIPGSTSLKGWL